MAQVAGCSPHKCKALSPNPSNFPTQKRQEKIILSCEVCMKIKGDNDNHGPLSLVFRGLPGGACESGFVWSPKSGVGVMPQLVPWTSTTPQERIACCPPSLLQFPRTPCPSSSPTPLHLQGLGVGCEAFRNQPGSLDCITASRSAQLYSVLPGTPQVLSKPSTNGVGDMGGNSCVGPIPAFPASSVGQFLFSTLVFPFPVWHNQSLPTLPQLLVLPQPQGLPEASSPPQRALPSSVGHRCSFIPVPVYPTLSGRKSLLSPPGVPGKVWN
jgi:hypothetical protein